MRWLVIGCGSIGRRHAQNLKTLGAGPLLAFDVAAEARQRLTADLGVPTAASLEEAWAWRPDVALIATSTNSHMPLALAAARRGCHLFIEKPLSHSLEDVPELCHEASARHLVTMVGCNLRFHPGPAKVQQLLARRAVGRVLAARLHTGSFLPRWRAGQDYRQSYSASTEWGGAILDCIHEIDLALWYFGPGKLQAAAHLSAESIGLQTEGLAELLVRHETGALSSVHLNFLERDYRRFCQIIGTEGTIDWDFGEKQVRVFDAEGQLCATHRQPETWQFNQVYLDELTHFLEAVRAGLPTMNPLAGGIAALVLALAARRPQH